jgi:MerR family copper efflux transcriptional regulator
VEYTIGELAPRFGLAHVTRVAEVLLGKDAGFSLEQSRELFSAPDRGRRREVLRGQLAQVRARMARLALSQTLLEHALRCRHPDYQSCPHFQGMVLARLDGVDLAEALDHP